MFFAGYPNTCTGNPTWLYLIVWQWPRNFPQSTYSLLTLCTLAALHFRIIKTPIWRMAKTVSRHLGNVFDRSPRNLASWGLVPNERYYVTLYTTVFISLNDNVTDQQVITRPRYSVCCNNMPRLDSAAMRHKVKYFCRNGDVYLLNCDFHIFQIRQSAVFDFFFKYSHFQVQISPMRHAVKYFCDIYNRWEEMTVFRFWTGYLITPVILSFENISWRCYL